jgi:copper resistance protein D
MLWLVNDFNLLTVLLRAASLSFEALLLGGFLYWIFVLRAIAGEKPAVIAFWRLGLTCAAIGLALAQIGYASADTVVLLATTSFPMREIWTASYMYATGLAVVAALLSIWLVGRKRYVWAAIVLGLLIEVATVGTSHAASRLDYRGLLMSMTLLHHLGTAGWIGAMPYMLLSLSRFETAEHARTAARRYSTMALASVGLLLSAGIVMTYMYVNSWSAWYGTSYGIMLASKIFLFAVLLVLGAGNFYLVRRLDVDPKPLLRRLSRFVEIEIGIGFSVILVAASLTSQPPASDQTMDRISGQQLYARMHPEWPRMESPPHALLTPAHEFHQAMQNEMDLIPTPRSKWDIAWSEYNHHWSGLVVLIAGLLALLSKTRWRYTGWARQWPLVFIALAVFLFLRADPENWPLGPRSFWESFYSSEVLEHRFFVLAILGFTFFEWGVQTGRVHSRKLMLVFPAVCAIGGGVLLTHSHGLFNVQEQLLAEYSHLPLAVAAILAGWSRWLELRLPPDDATARRNIKIAGLVWPSCLVLIGLILLNYREA